ncbi:hypothetical protein [Alkalimarinus alittae]|uniref:Uncharacterized protein n=1 Tax=Alkalimarinus alittae TaxID=2961619 RepID=A0ABY6MZN5_9ALTE|nr:hypothetical protein [Alkalimarinus alittae]UZE95306.1 hypothetical protein NKI27_14720 [Alkalimarinus alittae]
MSERNKNFEDIVDELKQERDELRVKLKLAKMDAGDEWEKVESQLEKLEAKAKEIGSATAEASKEIGAAAKLLAEEVRDGFKSIAKHF